MKRSSGRIWLPLFILLLALALVLAARAYAAYTQVWRDVNAAQSLGASDAASLEPLVAQTARDYRDLRAALAPAVYTAPFLGWLPVYGGDFENVSALLDLGDRVILGAENAVPLFSALDVKGAQPPLTAFLNVANTQKNVLTQSRRDYLQATQARARIDAAKLSSSTRRLLDRLDEALTLWRVALDAADVAPAQFGGEQPRVYLLLAQNSDELRPTGGFISSVALVRVQRGDISVTDFQDSYAVDDLRRFHPQPPVALTKYMFAGMLLLRDANWFPDFPTSARAAQNIYRVDRGIATDGVIAVNLKMLPRMLEAFDAVTVEPGSERVDAANAMEKIRTYWAPPQGKGPTPEWWSRRKDFMGQLLEAIMKRVKSGDYSRVKLARALADSIAAKDLLIYFKDVEESRQANFLWSGALADTSDALMIVDSNVGFNKMDGSVERRAEYTARIDNDGALRSVLTITYKNLSAADGKPCVHAPFYPPTYADLQQGCYWNYLRVIASAQSQLIRTEGIEDPVTEAPATVNRTIFGGYLVVPRGETRVVKFEYAASPNADFKSNYTLALEKEPGAPSIPFHVRVELPGRLAQEFALTLDRNLKILVGADASVGFWLIVLGALAVSVLIVGGMRLMRRKK